MRLTDLQQLFAEHGIRPNKKLGQCFLIDDNIARWIVEQAEITPEDVVVEVGPGAGALTRHLAGKCRRLVLVEKDAKLAALLKERFVDDDSVEVIHGDAVAYDVRPLFIEGPVKLIGNLPYSVGNEVLR
ncbi:MAG: ribosomal RNA small subunit methyltransferase A, partial [Verrucomicrobiae bacterium]|nr:ribosomal RNA small subunit methyltransferase A [Verrucomicrobiae bacterium]